ncbi:MAG: iron-containing alcohol dehydrogenase [Acidobacteria bacterium]|nr:MAG: iron-containing alcohol dehydrogenase [Acidobacteriota bacterium]
MNSQVINNQDRTEDAAHSLLFSLEARVRLWRDSRVCERPCHGRLARRCGLPVRLCEAGIPRDAIERMAAAAMKVTRLLKNNPRELSLADAESIYTEAYE